MLSEIHLVKYAFDSPSELLKDPGFDRNECMRCAFSEFDIKDDNRRHGNSPSMVCSKTFALFSKRKL